MWPFWHRNEQVLITLAAIEAFVVVWLGVLVVLNSSLHTWHFGGVALLLMIGLTLPAAVIVGVKEWQHRLRWRAINELMHRGIDPAEAERLLDERGLS